MSKYDAKIRHMERNVYKGLRSHRENYLNIGKHKHQSRECHTHSRTQTDTHSIQLVLCLSLHQSHSAYFSSFISFAWMDSLIYKITPPPLIPILSFLNIAYPIIPNSAQDSVILIM